MAGSLKLELAQYREVEAFSQFGSDLDQTTQYILKRGSKLVELLKQRQYSPLPLYYQVFILFSGIQGYLNNIDLKNISSFESFLIYYLSTFNSVQLKYSNEVFLGFL